MNYKTLFNFSSYEEFKSKWVQLNDIAERTFLDFISFHELNPNSAHSLLIKTIYAIDYRNVRLLNNYGLSVFRKEMEQDRYIKGKIKL